MTTMETLIGKTITKIDVIDNKRVVFRLENGEIFEIRCVEPLNCDSYIDEIYGNLKSMEGRVVTDAYVYNSNNIAALPHAQSYYAIKTEDTYNTIKIAAMGSYLHRGYVALIHTVLVKPDQQRAI